jgi:hypothetical protein
MSEKLCVFCEHMEWGIYGHSDYYEGDVLNGGQVACGKGHWCMQQEKFDYFWRDGLTPMKFAKGALAEAIQTAKKCPDYQPPDCVDSQIHSKERS